MWYIWDEAQAVPEGKSKSYEELAQMPMAPIYSGYTAFSLQLHTYDLTSSSLGPIEWGRKKTHIWFTAGSAWHAGTTHKWWHLSLGHPWMTGMKVNPLCEQNFEHRTWLFILLGRRNRKEKHPVLLFIDILWVQSPQISSCTEHVC